MTIQAIIVIIVLAALIIPVMLAEIRRRPAGRRPAAPRQREPVAKPPLRLVVNKNDMDRELAALLAKDTRKTTERDES